MPEERIPKKIFIGQLWGKRPVVKSHTRWGDATAKNAQRLLNVWKLEKGSQRPQWLEEEDCAGKGSICTAAQ